MGTQPARYSSVRPRVASRGCILASVLYFHAAEHRRPFDIQALDPGHVRAGLYGLVTEAAEDRDNLTHHDPVLRDLESDAAEHAVDVDYRRVPTHAGAPQIDLHAAEHGGNLAAAKIVRRHPALHAAENGVLVQHALVRPRRNAGGPGRRRRQPAPQHQQTCANQDQGPEISPREVEESEIVGQKQRAHADQDAASDPAAGNRRIHHFDQPHRDQDPRPVTPNIVQEKNVQVVEQEQHPDADYYQRRNDARNETVASPIIMWLHDVGFGGGPLPVSRKSANTPVIPARAGGTPGGGRAGGGTGRGRAL